MAEEKLDLIDGMSPSLKRIYQEAEKLNKRMLSLGANIKSLEKRGNLSYMRRELKTVENQARQTETALKRAVMVGTKQGVLSWNARYGGMQQHFGYGQKQHIKDEDLIRYGNYIKNAELRRNRMLWESGRRVNGMTFDERLAARRPSGIASPLAASTNSLNMFNDSLMGTITKIAALYYTIEGVVNLGKSLIQKQDEMVSIQTRLSLVNATPYTTQQFTENIFDTANRTRGDVEATSSLYNRIATSGVRASNERIRRFVETFNKSMVISGTSAQENRAVMLQLAQGMGSNRLGGDEFRSIAEQAPIFKYMLAKGMGVNPGALKQMGAEGKLTADAIMTAMEKTQGLVDTIFEKMPWTIGQLGTIIQNKWLLIINRNLVAYSMLRKELMKLIKWMDTPQGMKFFEDLFNSINNMIKLILMLSKIVMPTLMWIITHINIVGTSLLSVWAIMRTVALAEWFSIAATQAGLLGSTIRGVQTGLLGIGATLSPVIGVIMGIAGAVMAVVASLYAFRHINNELNPEKIRLDRNQKDARYSYERDIDTYIKNKIGPAPTYLSTAGSSIKLTSEERAQQDAWQRSNLSMQNQKKMLMYEWDEAAKSGTLLKFNRQDMDPYSKLQGMLDPNKNIPMEAKGGKINEVGRIGSDITISEESLKLMKAVAERQWIIQNEVTVPQKVENNFASADEAGIDQFVATLTEGTKVAVASSMKGTVMA